MPAVDNAGADMTEIESLLNAAPESPPCGPNLEYDAEFLEFETLARGKEEKRVGDAVQQKEEPPPWPEVADKARALLLRSKDLRVACVLVRAWMHVDGIAGFTAGMHLILGLLERYWDGIYPLLDADDGNDPTMRLNALTPLAKPQVLLHELRETALVRSRQHGQILVRDVECALNKLPWRNGVAAFTQAQLESALAAAFAEDGAVTPRVGDAVVAVGALSSFLDGKFGASRAPDLKPVLMTLQTLATVVREPTRADPQAATTPENQTAAPSPASPAADGTIRSRADAMAMIDAVIAYLQANEPTNPAPMLLRRAKRFMTMSFADIVKEIAPDSVDKLNVIAGPNEPG